MRIKLCLHLGIDVELRVAWIVVAPIATRGILPCTKDIRSDSQSCTVFRNQISIAIAVKNFNSKTVQMALIALVNTFASIQRDGGVVRRCLVHAIVEISTMHTRNKTDQRLRLDADDRVGSDGCLRYGIKSGIIGIAGGYERKEVILWPVVCNREGAIARARRHGHLALLTRSHLDTTGDIVAVVRLVDNNTRVNHGEGLFF